MNSSVWLTATFWPILGLLAVAVFSIFTRGRTRWWILFLGPVIAMLPCILFVSEIGENGNLLFVALLMIAFTVVIVYYPILIIIALIMLYRRNIPG